MSRDRTNDISERWVEWKVEEARRGKMTIVLRDGPSGAFLGRVYIDETERKSGKEFHVGLYLLRGLLSRGHTIVLDEKEALRPDHFEPLVADIEKVLPGLSGDVITAIFQAINVVKMLNARRRSER
jgi:hypothetical protein